MIELPDDFRDLLFELHAAGAEFVVVGGHAVAFHGHPRATKGLDVLVRATRENAVRVYRALAAFGAPLESFEISEADFVGYEGVLQVGLPPRRIDILDRVEGIGFDDAVAASRRSPGARSPRRRRATRAKGSSSSPRRWTSSRQRAAASAG